MDIAQIRSDFLIYVADDEESVRTAVVLALKEAGYRVQGFVSGEETLKQIRRQPPHIVISDIRMGGMTGIDLLEHIRSLSSDIQFIIMTSHGSLETAIHAMRLGAINYLNKPFKEITDVVMFVDRTAEKLFLQFQNEQLLEELAQKNRSLVELNDQIQRERDDVLKINKLMSDLALVHDVDSTIQIFLDATHDIVPKSPVLFFKYTASFFSLVLQNVSGLNMEQYRKVGFIFEEKNPHQHQHYLLHPEALPHLKELLRTVFHCVDYQAIPFEIEDCVVGVVVICERFKESSQRSLFDNYRQVSRVSYLNAVMQKRIHDMAIKDPLTGLYNRRYFNERIEEEIARARRTRMPLAIIYTDVDHFKKYNDQNGHPMGDMLLKMVATIFKKTSRKNDVVCRVGGEEFVIILPHTDKMGAAIKAEKIRRTIEGTEFPFGEKQPLGKVTMSFGVSEYPTLSHDLESLVRSADDALFQVKESTRNRVCLASAPQGLVPDYEPLPVSRMKES